MGGGERGIEGKKERARDREREREREREKERGRKGVYVCPKVPAVICSIRQPVFCVDRETHR